MPEPLSMLSPDAKESGNAMYSPTTLTGAGAGAALPFTGLSFHLVWLMLAAFALLSAGGALLRVAPSLHRGPTIAPRGRRPLR